MIVAITIEEKINLKIETEKQTFTFKTNYNLIKVIKIIQNEKRAIIITEELNELRPVFIFNLKTNFFKQICFIDDKIEFYKEYNYKINYKHLEKLKINEDGKRIRYDKNIGDVIIFNLNRIKVELIQKKENTFSLKLIDCKNNIKYYLFKCKTENGKNFFPNKQNITRLFYTGYDNTYCVEISIQKDLKNFFIFDTKKDSIGYKQMFLNVKGKTKKNIEDFVINNITTKKNKFNKNKMIFEVT